MAWVSPHGPAGAHREGHLRGALAAAAEEGRRLAGTGIFAGLLAVLLAADGLLILLHILHSLHDMRVIGDAGRMVADRRFLVSEDLGYGEVFGYLKSFAVAVALVACYLRARAPVFAALAFTFAVVVLDDSLRIHEFFGHLTEEALALRPAFGLRAQDLGELMVWSALGAVVAAALAVGFRRSGREARTLASVFLGLIALLVFFAVGIDMLQIALGGAFRGAHRVWTVIEEGGEMATLSLTCACAVAAAATLPGKADGAPQRVSTGAGYESRRKMR